MSWSIAEFLDLLQNRGIMAADHVDHLREQVADAGGDIHLIQLARKLVEAGYLNPYFAKTLLEEGYRRGRSAGPATARRASGSNDDLDLAPLEEEQRAKSAAAARAPLNLDIDLPPMSDPDAWPVSSEWSQPLPLVKLPSPHGLGTRTEAAAPSQIQRSSDLAWLLWALGAAVAVLVLIVLMLLISR